MRLRRNQGFHGLKRPKVRQSWNKYNLYNLAHYKSPVLGGHTYFQQKWKAKSASRKYHGEPLGEKQWERLFRPSIRSVVPMDPQQLARGDGREQARGRGGGLEKKQDKRASADTREPRRVWPTPYMNMVYAQLERRLDTAIFRAMFASSTRQARQFCVHGAVKVNGHKMVYPGYQLNPGDMFQVEPDRVMHATGAPKGRTQRRIGRRLREAREKGEDESLVLAKRKNGIDEEGGATATAEDAAEDTVPIDSKEVLSQLLSTARSITGSSTLTSAQQKQNLRQFTRLVRSTLSRANQGRDISNNTQGQLDELMSKLNITMERPQSQSATTSSAAAPVEDASAVDDGRMKPIVPTSETQMIKTHERKQLELALAEARDNPVDAAKPYATPWRPKPWMSAFAFIPRYLEVHHKICSAVYLRHPVARPGLAEVPTPFDAEILGLAFNWYLRRR